MNNQIFYVDTVTKQKNPIGIFLVQKNVHKLSTYVSSQFNRSLQNGIVLIHQPSKGFRSTKWHFYHSCDNSRWHFVGQYSFHIVRVFRDFKEHVHDWDRFCGVCRGWFQWNLCGEHGHHLPDVPGGSGLTPVLLVLGWVSNALSVLVMTRPHNCHLSCCVYMSVLAICNIVCLYVALHWWMMETIQKRFFLFYECKCVVLSFLLSHGYVDQHRHDIWSLYRNQNALKVAFLCTESRAKKMSLAIFVVIWPYCSQYFLFASNVDRSCVFIRVQSKLTQILSYIGVF